MSDAPSSPPQQPTAPADPGARAAGDADLLPPPTSASELFFAFTKLALQGFGGVLAVAQRELVERRRWLSREVFVELLAVSQVLPGPNVVNLSLMVGDRFLGLRGAFAALAGMLAVPLVIVLAITVLYAEFARLPMVSGALRGMGAVAAGLVLATAVKLLATLRSTSLGVGLGLAFTAVTFAVVVVLRWPLIWVLGLFGSIAFGWAWLRLGGRG
ncbi:chromate transporter [Piscinibacter koreensis]|uniref:Chromate transporter n=1 Tax=Piscinibacter koreensis TaxID=2742824 RepID=A0A7Y6NR37_9BURK|nr:chromate transporter [Schlegelella koreensis]NUZ07797.1 chromate transporter [Schlegelella koreensis]